MNRSSVVMSVLLASLAGCAAGGSRPKQEEPLGNLSLYLVGTDSHGQQYRLRNAEFDVQGYSYYGSSSQVSTILSTEADPNADQLETRLVPGQYVVTLGNHLWYLEKLTDRGAERVDHAVLLSSESQYAYVYDRGTTEVYFSFGVNGELIDFRHGNLRIGIIIEQPDNDGGSAPAPDQDGGATR
jgi:hypothetical protein